MSTTTIAAREMAPFGAELELDAREPLDDAGQARLRELFDRHDLLLVRGPRLTMEEQLRFCGHLGPVLLSDSGEMSKETPIGLAGVELCFHADYGYSPEPLQAISLHAVDVVDGETSTRFASGRLAWEALDDATRERLEGVDALQVFGARLDRRNRRADLDARLPDTAHPIAPGHPAGGRYLYAPEMTTDSLVGLDPAEGEALLERVFAALYDPGQVLEHRWSEGDLVIWHNTRVVHARGDVSAVGRRVHQRVALGTKGYYDLYPELANYAWDEAGNIIEAPAPY